MIYATVISSLDYYNLVYVGLPFKLTKKSQLVQNAVVGVLTGTPATTHIQMMLHQLQWLQTEYSIRFKALFVYLILAHPSCK